MAGAERARWLRWPSGRAGMVLLGLFALLLAGLLLLWSQRVPIAENFIDQQLEARKIQASYRIGQIGARTQRIENLVLGDPAKPDLTARWIEVDIGYFGLVPRVVAIRAEGLRLYGRVEDGALKLGELDKFMGGESKEPFSLPDIDLSLDDARAQIMTPAGPVGAVLEGRGNLSGGFRGKLAALVRNPKIAGCASPQVSAYLDVAISAGKPRLAGPIRSAALGCPGEGVTVAGLVAQVDLQSDTALTRLGGRITTRAKGVKAGGVLAVHPAIEAEIDGSAKTIGGTYRIAVQSLDQGTVKAGRVHSDGALRWTRDGAKGGFAIGGRLDASNIAALDRRSLTELKAAMKGTPVAPLAYKLLEAIANASVSNRMEMAYDASHSAGKGHLVVSAADLKATSGARIRMGEGSRFRLEWPNVTWALDGSVTSEGGDLPRAALRLQQAGAGAYGGQLFMEPYQAGTARLSAEPVRFVARPDGSVRVDTRLHFDGPLPDGSIKGLDLPLRANMGPAGLFINPGCSPLHAASLRFGTISASRLAITLCPLDGKALLSSGRAGLQGGAVVRGLHLAGRMGDTPAVLKADQATMTLADTGLKLTGAELLLGQGDTSIRLAAAGMDGQVRKSGMGGNAQGIEARIGTVPLLAREGNARWTFAGGALKLEGVVGIIDAAVPDRFNPLVSRDFVLTMADGRITATGGLSLPKGSAELARVAIRHELASGKGVADLKVDGLRFGPALQPDEVTRLALGVVANVNAVINGTGQIRWNGNNVTSDGLFSTQNADLAAAFGPVSGLSGEMRFTDLIGLVTAPGQTARIRSVNPGIEARDGVIRYALLPGQRVAVESGHWPFAGGELFLLPTVMDFSADHPRNVTFRVIGLDAGSFIQTLELENISATGTFDGLLPMIFDSNGGKIVGGVLVARQEGMPPLVIDKVEGLSIPCDRSRQGGMLSYVGQVSNEQVGKMGKLAFDALKDLQYKCLTILMDGNIDGEVVTQVAFNGVNRGELSTVPKMMSRQFTGLPFIFNVRIAAPFRGLMNTAKTFVDPGLLIQSHMNDQYESTIENKLAVQPRESETGAKGERK